MSEVASKDKKPGRKIGNNSLYIGIGLVAAVVVLTVGTFLLLRSTKVVDPVALKVGEVEIKQSQLDEYINLGKSSGVTESTVRKTVIEHAKNKQMAEKYKIDMPELYVQRLGNLVTVKPVQVSNNASQASTHKTEPDAYTQLVYYNRAFATRMSEQQNNGMGIFIYEIGMGFEPGDDAEQTKAKKSTLDIAAQYRNSIAQDTTQAERVLEEVVTYNKQNGMNGQSGIRFIREYTGDKADIWIGNLASDAYIYETLKNKDTGLSDVYQTTRGSAWFAYTLYKQKVQPKVPAQITEEKTKMKVVIYDEQ